MNPVQPDPAAPSVSSISRAELSTMDTAPFPVIIPGGWSEPASEEVPERVDVRVDIRAPLFPEWPAG